MSDDGTWKPVHPKEGPGCAASWGAVLGSARQTPGLPFRPALQKLLGANVFSFYKFHPCIKAPELLPAPHSKIKQQPDTKNNIVKIVRFFFFSVNHALKIKIASAKDI